MIEQPVDDGRSTTRVVFSLSVSSRSPIPEFADIPSSHRDRARAGGFSYDFGTMSSVNDMWGVRTDALDVAITAALDRLDDTGIDPDELAVDGRVVRARVSVSPGAETIPASVVARLARIHANILMDSWG